MTHTKRSPDYYGAQRIAKLEAINAELLEALEAAVAVAETCKALHDEQANRHFQGDRPNWRKASSAIFDEIDNKPDEWRAAIARARGES